MYPQKVCYWIKQFFRAFVFLSCLGIVIWQCWRCLEKFLSKPQVTQLSIVNPAGKMFPSITVCRAFLNNLTILSNCGITKHQYYREAIWSNQDIDGCGDPKELFYSTTSKLEDLISEVHVVSYNKSTTVFDNKTKLFYPVHFDLGICYTFLPPEENLRDGIFRIIFVVKRMVRIYVHTNGVLAVKQVSTALDVSPYKCYGVKIEHSLYKMLDFQGVPCNNEKSYRLDKCILKGLEEESLKTIGCVTPFGFTTDRICQNEQNSKKALQLYHEYRNDNMATKNISCFEPCSYLGVKLFKTSEWEPKNKKGMFSLTFDEKIHETVAHYSYDDLSFVAEIGGYVGLFLGASVYQTADLFQFITEILEKFFQ